MSRLRVACFCLSNELNWIDFPWVVRKIDLSHGLIQFQTFTRWPDSIQIKFSRTHVCLLQIYISLAVDEAQENALTWMTVKCSAIFLSYSLVKTKMNTTRRLTCRSGSVGWLLPNYHRFIAERTAKQEGLLNVKRLPKIPPCIYSDFVCTLRAFGYAFAIFFVIAILPEKNRRERNIRKRPQQFVLETIISGRPCSDRWAVEY